MRIVYVMNEAVMRSRKLSYMLYTRRHYEFPSLAFVAAYGYAARTSELVGTLRTAGGAVGHGSSKQMSGQEDAKYLLRFEPLQNPCEAKAEPEKDEST